MVMHRQLNFLLHKKTITITMYNIPTLSKVAFGDFVPFSRAVNT